MRQRIEANEKKIFGDMPKKYVAIILTFLVLLCALSLRACMADNEDDKMVSDEQTMQEVVDVIRLSLADSGTYDEFVKYCVVDNVSCYIDRPSEEGLEKNITRLASSEMVAQYNFGDEVRKADKTPYTAAGNMYGITITFEPSVERGEPTYDLKEGRINKFVSEQEIVFGSCVRLHGLVCHKLDNKIDLCSKSYRNSEYTVFVCFADMKNGDQFSIDDLIIYGQFSGTNLSGDIQHSVAEDRVVGIPAFVKPKTEVGAQ